MNVNQKTTSKPLHSNINDLVDLYQTQSCLFTRSQSINLTSNNRPKTMSMHRMTLAEINNPGFRPLNIQNGHFVHTRSMSNVINRGLQAGNRQGVKNSQQTRKQKMINMLSTQNFRKQLMNTRKMSAVQTQYRSVDVRNKNNKKDYDLRFNVLQNNYELQKEGTSKQSAYDKNSNFQSRIKGEFYQQRIDSQQNQGKHDLRNPLTIDKHEYLRKNSSINKSILNTILKQKIAKQAEKDKQQMELTKNIRNEQIVKMIKVYKGIQPIISVRQKNEEPNIELKAKENKNKDLLHIQGWQNQTQDFEFNRSHGPEQNSSSHVQLQRQIQIREN